MLAVVAAHRHRRASSSSLGAHVLDGGPTLNPSTYELLAGIHAVPAEEVVVLPNSPNVIMAAERAAELSEKQVVVVPVAQPADRRSPRWSRTRRRARRRRERARRSAEALARVRSGSVAPAARDDAEGRFSVGEAVGFVERGAGRLGRARRRRSRTCSRTLGDGSELITCIAGAGAPLDAPSGSRRSRPTAVELEHRDGGQPSYWWLLAAE